MVVEEAQKTEEEGQDKSKCKAEEVRGRIRTGTGKRRGPSKRLH